MIGNDVFSRINGVFNSEDQHVLFRSTLSNQILQHLLKDKVIQNFVFETTPSIQKFIPFNLALFLTYPEEYEFSSECSGLIKTHQEELIKNGVDAFQRFSIQKSYIPNIKDALSIAFFLNQKIGESSIDANLWKLINNLIFQTKDVDFWSIILSCLLILVKTPDTIYKSFFLNNPVPDLFEALVNTFILNQISDNNIDKVSQSILADQSNDICVQYLNLLNKKGLSSICQSLAKHVLKVKYEGKIDVDFLERVQNNDYWGELGRASKYLQDVALINYYAGHIEDAKTIFLRSKNILQQQSESLDELIKEVNSSLINQSDDLFEKQISKGNLVDANLLEYQPQITFPIIPIEKIRESIRQGKYSAAETIILNYQNCGTIDPVLNRLSAEILSDQGGYSQAVQELLIADSLSPLINTDKFLLAYYDYLDGNYQQAYQTIFSLRNNGIILDSGNLEKYGLYALRSGHLEEATVIISELESNTKNKEKSLILLVELAIIHKDFDKASNYLNQVIDLNKEQPQVWFLLSKIQEGKGAQEKILESILTGLKYCPESQSLLFEAAKQYQIAGNSGLFKQHISKLICLPFESTELILEISDFIENSNDIEMAQAILMKANKRWPKSISIIHRLSQIFIKQNRFSQAIKYLEGFDQQLNHDNLITYLLALFSSQKDYFPIQANLGDEKNQEKIKETLDRLSLLFPDDHWTNLFNAVLLLLKKEYQKSYDILTGFLSKIDKSSNVTDWKFQLALGQLLLEIGKPESSIAIFQELAQRGENPFEIRQFLASAFHACGLDEKAFEIIIEGFAWQSDGERYVQWLSKFIVDLGKGQKVISDLKQREVNSGISLNEVFLLAYLSREDDSTIRKIIEKLRKTELNFKQSEQLLQLIFFTQSYKEAELFINSLKTTSPSELRKSNLYKASLDYFQRKYSESEISLKSNIAMSEELNIETLFLLDIYEQTKNTENSGQLIGKYFGTSQLLNRFLDLSVSDECQDLYPVLPEVWKVFVDDRHTRTKLVIDAFLRTQEPGKVLEVLDRTLSVTELNESLAEKTIEIAKNQLAFGLVEKILNIYFSPDHMSERQSRERIDLACQWIEMALINEDELRAASILNKIVQGNEEDPRIEAIQARILRREGDLQNSKDIYIKSRNILGKPESWLLEAAFDMQDHEGFVDLFKEILESKDLSPLNVLYFLKEKAALVKSDQISRELHSIMPEKKQLIIIDDLHMKLTDEITRLARVHPEIKKWNDINDALLNGKQSQELSATDCETIPYIAFLMHKTINVDGLRRLQSEHDDNPDINFLLALTVSDEKSDEARKNFVKAISINPNNQYYLIGFAFFEKKCGNLLESLDLLNKALVISPENNSLRKMAIKQAANLSKWEDVIKHGEYLLNIYPGDKSTIQELLNGYMQKGDLKRSSSRIKKLDLESFNSFEASIIMANEAIENKNIKQAIGCLDKAQLQNPDSCLPLTMLSELFLDLGQKDRAHKYAAQAIEKNPMDEKANLAMAAIILQLDGNSAAIKFLKSAIEKGNGSEIIHSKLAELIKAANGLGYAIDFIKSNLTSDHAQLYALLAQYEMENGSENEAEQHALIALSKQQNNEALLKILGKIMMHRGNLDQAVKYLSDAVSSETSDIENYLSLSDLYLQRREVEKALNILDQGIHSNGENWCLYKKAGKICWDIKNYRLAETYFRMAQQLNPDDESIRKQLDSVRTMNIIHAKQEVNQ